MFTRFFILFLVFSLLFLFGFILFIFPELNLKCTHLTPTSCSWCSLPCIIKRSSSCPSSLDKMLSCGLGVWTWLSLNPSSSRCWRGNNTLHVHHARWLVFHKILNAHKQNTITVDVVSWYQLVVWHLVGECFVKVTLFYQCALAMNCACLLTFIFKNVILQLSFIFYWIWECALVVCI